MPEDYYEDYRVLGQYGWIRTAGGSSGVYSFYRPAYEQMQRSWVVHVVMQKGSDILIAVNRNAEFVRKCRSQWWGSDGSHGEDCDVPMKPPLGYSVGWMYGGPQGAHVLEVLSSNRLKLDKKASEDVLQYDVMITPPDYIDMCACVVPSSPTPAKSETPCVQGMSLAPGQSCGITVSIPVGPPAH